MAHSRGPSTKIVSPQNTGYSQLHSRAAGDGTGQTMSVLLSWHEKVNDNDTVSLAGADRGSSESHWLAVVLPSADFLTAS